MSTKKTFRLAGDILQPGIIEVEAETLEQAIEEAEAGNFQIIDSQDSCLGFKLAEVIEDDEAKPVVVSVEEGP